MKASPTKQSFTLEEKAVRFRKRISEAQEHSKSPDGNLRKHGEMFLKEAKRMRPEMLEED